MVMNELNTTLGYTLQEVADELCETKKEYIEHGGETLSSNLNYRDSLDEQFKVALAERYLEHLGVKVKTDTYGYYRNIYDVLRDFGEYLSKNDYKPFSLSEFIIGVKI